MPEPSGTEPSAPGADGESETAGPKRDKPWLFRTYAGHSTARASNRLFRDNLSRGQTGLSIAFDLPTQTGYDSDHPLAEGEVGKVGVPVCHLGDMRILFDRIPLAEMNTSMTINATAPWLLALYVALADEQGAPRAALTGTVQNDVIKEYLARGTHIFPPSPSLRLTSDVIGFAARETPKWNPVNVCSYHLQEAGATPVQELAFALATACAVLDQVRRSGAVPAADFPRVAGRISFFVNAGIRFVTEICKLRAFTELWDTLLAERYGIAEAKYRRFRYGVQVNSLGLTEQQPENNVYRILLEMLAVVLSKDARARAVQLPTWNEALGLPRPWDQQWSLRLQQIVAYETDLLEFGDIFAGSVEIAATVADLKRDALAELARIDEIGGVIAAVETGYLKRALVDSSTRRIRSIMAGVTKVVGVNLYTESEPSALLAEGEVAVATVDDRAERTQCERLAAWRAGRDGAAVVDALARLEADAQAGRNVMAASIACAKVGATTGEWADALRRVFGEYRAPTGVCAAGPAAPGAAHGAAKGADNRAAVAAVRRRVEAVAARLGRRPKILVGKPGLDGHSNGAEQIVVAARDCGFEVVYEGIRLTPAEIVAAALEEAVHLVGLSVLSGSHMALTRQVLAGLAEAGLDLPVVIGGIIPPADAAVLRDAGIAGIYTPKDFDLARIMADIVDIIERRGNLPAAGGAMR